MYYALWMEKKSLDPSLHHGVSLPNWNRTQNTIGIHMDHGSPFVREWKVFELKYTVLEDQHKCNHVDSGSLSLCPWGTLLLLARTVMISLTRRREEGIGEGGIRWWGIGEGWFTGISFSLDNRSIGKVPEHAQCTQLNYEFKWLGALARQFWKDCHMILELHALFSAYTEGSMQC